MGREDVLEHLTCGSTNMWRRALVYEDRREYEHVLRLGLMSTKGIKTRKRDTTNRYFPRFGSPGAILMCVRV